MIATTLGGYGLMADRSPPSRFGCRRMGVRLTNDRAADAAHAVATRHLRRLLRLPGTRIADVTWPKRKGR